MPTRLIVPGAPSIGRAGRRVLLSSASLLLPLHSRIVYFGDSITDARGFAGYADWAQVLTRGRFYGKAEGSNGLGPTGWNQGVVGNQTGQMITRISNVTAESPKVVVVLAGTNDIGAGSLPASTIQTNLRSIYNTCLGAGARVLALTILPRASTGWDTGQETTRTAVNAWIKAQTDIDWIDADTLITATATYFQSDLTHPIGTGAQVIGTAVAAKLNTFVVGDDILASLPTAPSENKFTNPFFTGGTTTATGWSFFGATDGLTKTASKTTWGAYEAQKLTMSGTATANVSSNFNANATFTGLVTGDLVEAWVEIKVVKATGISGISISPGNSGTQYNMMSVTSQNLSALSVPFEGVMRTLPFALTADNQTLNARISFIPNNGSTVDAEFIIRRAGFRKVPAGQ